MRVPRSILLPALLVAGAAVATGCSSGTALRGGNGGDRSPGQPPVVSASKPTASAPTTTAPSPPTTVAPPTTTTYAPSGPQASPYGAASRLIDDWSTGNRAAAASVAAPAAVQTLFAIAYPAGWIQYRGCTASSTDPGTCTYRNTETNGLYEITVTRAAAPGWYVSAVIPES